MEQNEYFSKCAEDCFDEFMAVQLGTHRDYTTVAYLGLPLTKEAKDVVNAIGGKDFQHWKIVVCKDETKHKNIHVHVGPWGQVYNHKSPNSFSYVLGTDNWDTNMTGTPPSGLLEAVRELMTTPDIRQKAIKLYKEMNGSANG